MRKMIILLLLVGCKTNQVSLSPINDKKTDGDVTSENASMDTSEEMAAYRGAIYEERAYQLGNESVFVATYRKDDGLSFINLHDDENTSVLAAVAVIDSLGGELIQLKHTGERNIKFKQERQRYEFDPNRMFTDKGARASLENFARHDEKGLASVRSFAQSLVASINSEVIFTLHNNTEDNYSAKSYLNEYKVDAADVYINPKRDPDDFFFVTERLFFDAFKLRGYNVVLQDNKTMTDDGSLSVLAAQRKIPYINIEAQHGHLAEQIDMLLTVYELFN